MEKKAIKVEIYLPSRSVATYEIGNESEHGVVKELFVSSNPLCVRVYFEEIDMLFMGIQFIATCK